MQLANNRIIELQGQLNAPEQRLSNAVISALKGFAEVASHNVYAFSEKQAKHKFLKPTNKAFIALVHATTLQWQVEVKCTPAWPCQLAKDKLKFAINFVEAN